MHDQSIKVVDGKLDGVYPSKWEGVFRCPLSKLTSLKGAPAEVNGSVFCFSNHLISLEGAPSIIEDSFYCHANKITSVQNINHYVKKIGRTFYSDENLTGLISLLLIEHPPTDVGIGPLSEIFNDALKKIHAGQDRMEAIMGVILNTPDDHAWQLGELE